MSNSTNSTVMSYGPVTNYTDTAPSGLSVCANYQNTTGSIVVSHTSSLCRLLDEWKAHG